MKTLLLAAALLACSTVATARDAHTALGTTPAEIHARFAHIIERNFESGDTDGVLSRLTDGELHALARDYGRETRGDTSHLLKVLARRASARNLGRVSAHFGLTNTYRAIGSDAPSDVAAAFYAGHFSKMQAAPDVDMTLEEIYLEFRTAPGGSLSLLGALEEAATYIATKVSVGFGAGYAVGTAASYLLETFAPDTNVAIGGTIDAALTNLQAAAAAFMAGAYESDLASMFDTGPSMDVPVPGFE